MTFHVSLAVTYVRERSELQFPTASGIDLCAAGAMNVPSVCAICGGGCLCSYCIRTPDIYVTTECCNVKVVQWTTGFLRRSIVLFAYVCQHACMHACFSQAIQDEGCLQQPGSCRQVPRTLHQLTDSLVHHATKQSLISGNARSPMHRNHQCRDCPNRRFLLCIWLAEATDASSTYTQLTSKQVHGLDVITNRQVQDERKRCSAANCYTQTIDKLPLYPWLHAIDCTAAPLRTLKSHRIGCSMDHTGG